MPTVYRRGLSRRVISGSHAGQGGREQVFVGSWISSREVLATGLKELGATVDSVVAYRSVDRKSPTRKCGSTGAGVGGLYDRDERFDRWLALAAFWRLAEQNETDQPERTDE